MQRIVVVACSAVALLAAASPAVAATAVSETAGRIPASTNGRVDAIATVNGRVYLGGSFTTAGGLSRRGLAAVNASTGQVDSTWSADVAGTVLTLAVSPDGTTLYVGGSFTKVGAFSRLNLAAVSTASGAVTPWDPGASNGSVRGLAVSTTTVYAGGNFTASGSTAIGRLSAIDRFTGRADPAFDPHPDSAVNTLRLAGATLYAGGKFSTIAGVARPHLAALVTASGQATGWHPRLTCPALDLATDATKIYVACAGGASNGNSVVAFGTGTSATSPVWLRSGNGDVQSIAVLGGVVYAGGHFGTMAGATRHHAAAFDPTSGALLGWSPVFNSALGVWAIHPVGSALWAGGDFTTVNSASHPHVARFQ